MFGEAVKRLDRLAPHLVHICGFVCEWTWAKYNSPLDTPGGLRGVSHTFKCLGKLSHNWTDWHHIWYTSADSSGNWHRLNTIRPSITQGAFWEVLVGHKFKSLLKLSNGWTDWHQLRFMSADSSGNGDRLNTSRPIQSVEQFDSFPKPIQMSGEAVKLLDRLSPNLVHVCGFVWEWA